jgi:glycosyltransferase involved in cell wall biosynthesis
MRSMMHVGIDARLRAYRGGGIAEHVARLITGLLRLEAVAGSEPDVRLTLFEHRRARRTRKLDPSQGAPVLDEAFDSQARSGEAGFETAALPLGLDATAEGGPPADRLPANVTRRWLWTPPHYPLEGWVLPLEILLHGPPGILHCPDVVLPRAWRGPTVVTVHDVAFLRRPELLTEASNRYYAGIHRSVAQATRVIVVSDYTRGELLRRTDVDPAKVRVVPNAVAERYHHGEEDAVATAKDAEVAMRLGLRRPFLLFVSTIEPRKNVPTLLEAFSWLLEQGRDIELLLVGADGWKSDEVYRRAEELGLSGRARFLGWVGDEDLSSLYRQAVALAHPALDEGFGLTPLEAMASGTPVVVSDAGSLPEVVAEAGLRVPPRDARSWTSALDRVIDDVALRSRLVAEGRQRAAAFTIHRQASETLAVYREAWSELRGTGTDGEATA